MLDRLLEMEAPEDKRPCAICGKEWSPWRCLDCMARPSLCTECCLERHKTDYLHRLERWVPKEADQTGHRVRPPFVLPDLQEAETEAEAEAEAEGATEDQWTDDSTIGPGLGDTPSMEGSDIVSSKSISHHTSRLF